MDEALRADDDSLKTIHINQYAKEHSTKTVFNRLFRDTVTKAEKTAEVSARTSLFHEVVS